MIDGLLEVFESVSRHRLRALATAFGVFWGIFMLTMLLASGRGLRNGIDTLFSGDSVNSVWIYGNRTVRAFEGLGAGRTIHLTVDDADALLSSVAELEHVSPRRGLAPSIMITRGDVTSALPGVAIYPSYGVTEKVKMVRGRWLNDYDERQARKVVVIGGAARKVLFSTENPIGKYLVLGGVEFQVIGEYTDSGNEEENRRVYLPFSAMQRTFDASRHVEWIVGALKPDASVELARKRILRVLGLRHRFDSADEGAVMAWFAVEDYRKMLSLLRGIDLGILAVGLGTLLSGMVGVSNILFVSVRERAQEFGVRRALGASARSVLWLVITEALGLASVAGGLGLAAALGTVEMIRAGDLETDFFRDPKIDLQTALLSLAMLVVTALVAGYFPAREAARMHPIEALRRE